MGGSIRGCGSKTCEAAPGRLLERFYLIGLGAFFTWNFDEFDGLTLDQRAMTLSDDGLVMHEEVFTAVALDEAVTFGAVEPFYGACLCF